MLSIELTHENDPQEVYRRFSLFIASNPEALHSDCFTFSLYLVCSKLDDIGAKDLASLLVACHQLS